MTSTTTRRTGRRTRKRPTAGRQKRPKTADREKAGAADKQKRSRRKATGPSSARTKSTRRTPGTHAGRPGAGALREWLPAMRQPAGLGLGAIVAVVEGTGAGWDQAVAVAHRLSTMPRNRAARSAAGGLKPEQTNTRAARALLRASCPEELARVLGALGSTHRLRILFKLLEGAATYRTLQKVTGLKAGPLYHHISQLRLAELIGPKQRDLYDLTRAGRNVVVVASVLGALARDRRPRPAPVI